MYEKYGTLMNVGIYGEGECCAAKALILPIIKIIKLFPFKKSIKHMFCLVEVQLVCVLESWSNGWCRLMAGLICILLLILQNGIFFSGK